MLFVTRIGKYGGLWLDVILCHAIYGSVSYHVNTSIKYHELIGNYSTFKNIEENTEAESVFETYCEGILENAISGLIN